MSIDALYREYGPVEYYRRFGSGYRNPHEPIVDRVVRAAVAHWSLPLSRVLDVACGSGEVTLAVQSLGAIAVDGVDPFTHRAYLERTGLLASLFSFDDIAAGSLAGRSYDLIVCSFALHLAESSRIPRIAQQLALIGDGLLIVTPHKRPQLRTAWGWRLIGELMVERVRARYYRSTLRTDPV